MHYVWDLATIIVTVIPTCVALTANSKMPECSHVFTVAIMLSQYVRFRQDSKRNAMPL